MTAIEQREKHSTLPVQCPPGRPTLLLAQGTPAYRRMAGALILAGFATFSVLYGVQPLLPLFAVRFGIQAAEASLAISLATASMALLFIPAALLSDRIGRRRLITISLFASAALTILSALSPNWGTLLAMRAATGVALAGVPGVAMTYIAEEVDQASIGSVMGLYIAGTVVGSMTGRLGVSLIADLTDWRLALGLTGGAGLVCALGFRSLAPVSRAFGPMRQNAGAFLAATKRLLRDDTLPLLYAEGFLLMGAFITFYNYVGFRLQSAPYYLSQTQVGLIFLVYIVGSFSSAWFGGFAGRIGRTRVFWMPITVLLLGVFLTWATTLSLIILGIGVVTAAYFAAHSVASGWVSAHANQDRAQASALYLSFYYLGSSIFGTLGGFAWTHFGWEGVALYAGALVGVALAISVRLAFMRSGPSLARRASV